MRTPLLLLSLFSLLLPGCSHLIVRDDDTIAESTAKVTTRVVMGLPTLGLSEMGMQYAKEQEILEAQVAECKEKGLIPVVNRLGTPATQFQGCFSQDGYERFLTAQQSQRPDPAMAILMLQAMNPPVQARREPLPIPNLQRPVMLNCSGLNNGGISTTTCY